MIMQAFEANHWQDTLFATFPYGLSIHRIANAPFFGSPCYWAVVRHWCGLPPLQLIAYLQEKRWATESTTQRNLLSEFDDMEGEIKDIGITVRCQRKERLCLIRTQMGGYRCEGNKWLGP